MLISASPPQKHHVKSQWSIIDDIQILKNIEKDTEHKKKRDTDNDNRTIKNRSSLINVLLKFATECSQSYLLDQSTRLSEVSFIYFFFNFWALLF